MRVGVLVGVFVRTRGLTTRVRTGATEVLVAGGGVAVREPVIVGVKVGVRVRVLVGVLLAVKVRVGVAVLFGTMLV